MLIKLIYKEWKSRMMTQLKYDNTIMTRGELYLKNHWTKYELVGIAFDTFDMSISNTGVCHDFVTILT